MADDVATSEGGESASGGVTPEAPVAVDSAPVGGESAAGGEAAVQAVNPWAIENGEVRLKANGKEHSFKSLAEIKRAAEMGLGAQRAIQERAELAKEKEAWQKERQEIAAEINSFVEQGKKAPDALLRQLGIDPVQFAEAQLRGHLEQQALTPEQRAERERMTAVEREAAELRAWRQQREQADQTAAQQAEEAKRQEENQAAMAELQAAITKELEADPVLGVEGLRVKIMRDAAWEMAAANAEGIYLPPDKAVAVVRAERQAAIKEHVKGMTPEQVIAFFGEDWARGIREYDVGRVKTAQKEAVKAARAGDKEPQQFLTLQEMLKSRNRG